MQFSGAKASRKQKQFFCTRLRRAIELDKAVRKLALDDEDLKPLWDEIPTLEQAAKQGTIPIRETTRFGFPGAEQPDIASPDKIAEAIATGLKAHWRKKVNSPVWDIP